MNASCPSLYRDRRCAQAVRLFNGAGGCYATGSSHYFHVWTNWAFQDIDEGKSREIDVRAIKRVAHNEEKKLSAFVEIIAECKNSTNPFVFIGRSKNQMDSLALEASAGICFPKGKIL